MTWWETCTWQTSAPPYALIRGECLPLYELGRAPFTFLKYEQAHSLPPSLACSSFKLAAKQAPPFAARLFFPSAQKTFFDRLSSPLGLRCLVYC